MRGNANWLARHAAVGPARRTSGRGKALYDPVYGGGPDIAGKDVANPLACTLAFSMMLRYSFDMAQEADLVEKPYGRHLFRG